jgi:hypothetical protein
MRIENAGFLFYIEKKINFSKEALTEIKKSLSCLPPEYGNNIIYSSDSKYFWAYFKPESEVFPNQNIIIDDENSIILFTGLIYSLDGKNKTEAALRKINNTSALKSLLNEISGTYCGIIYNKKEQKGWAFTDKIVIQMLFYLNDEDNLVFSSNLTVLKTVKSKNEYSSIAFSSIVFASHTIQNTVINNINQVNAGCLIEFDHKETDEKEYQIYPQRKNLSIEKALEIINEAYGSFWQRIAQKIRNDNVVCLSRGKDSRIILKHMLDYSCEPYAITYFRKDNPAYPLITVKLTDTYDSMAAVKILKKNCLSFRYEKIDNIYLLDNLKDILMLNHGTPLHWELHAVGNMMSGYKKYIFTGFLGETIAGKCPHYYYFKKIEGPEAYGKLDFNSKGDAGSYNKIRMVLDSSGIKLNGLEELEQIFIEQYKIARTDNLENIHQEGYLRTRALGRDISTFHQSRIFAVPIYPFIDNFIRESYMSIPVKFLKWEKIHLMQISGDRNYNFIPTTRSPLNAKWEERTLSIFGLFRKMEKFLSVLEIKSFRRRPDLETAILKSFGDFPDFPLSAIAGFLKNRRITFTDYETLLNLINALRIEKYFIKYKPELRSSIKFIEYKTKA